MDGGARKPPLGGGDQLLEHVHGPEGEIGVAAGIPDLPVPDPAQQGLGAVGQVGDEGQLQEGGGPLDGVEGPENRAHRVHVVRIRLQVQQRLLGVADQVGALVDEGVQQVRIHRFGQGENLFRGRGLGLRRASAPGAVRFLVGIIHFPRLLLGVHGGLDERSDLLQPFRTPNLGRGVPGGQLPGDPRRLPDLGEAGRGRSAPLGDLGQHPAQAVDLREIVRLDLDQQGRRVVQG